jgi:hypothetical protein
LLTLFGSEVTLTTLTTLTCHALHSVAHTQTGTRAYVGATLYWLLALSLLLF